MLKKIPIFLVSATALTLLFYLLGYYLLPNNQAPLTEIVPLFAIASVVLIWIGQALLANRKARNGIKKR